MQKSLEQLFQRIAMNKDVERHFVSEIFSAKVFSKSRQSFFSWNTARIMSALLLNSGCFINICLKQKH